MLGLTWLHLSDWHQRCKDFHRKMVRDALIEDIKNRRDIHTELEKLDFIVFSGDLAFSGKKEEYLAGQEYLLDPLLDAASLDKSRIFIVPGNHDLDRDSFELLPDGIKKPLTEEDEINKWLEDDDSRSKMIIPFKAYNEFIHAYNQGNFTAYAGSLELPIAGKKIALLGFNSALMCGRHKDENNEIHDKGKIIVGESQVYDTLNKHRDADIRIVVLHHPFDWLTDKDCINVERRLKEAAHFMLCGHQHRPKVTIETGTEGDCIIIPAGASYERSKTADSHYKNAYNFVHLDFANNKGAVYLRTWSDTTKKWRQDIDTYPGGRFDFTLPKELSVSVSKEEQDKTRKPNFIAAATFHPDNPVFNVPFRAKGDGMVGREEALQKVREHLTAGQPTAIGHTAAFQGLGGLGKTQLAVEYAHRFRSEYPLGVIWINADQEIEPQLIQIAKLAKWIHPDSKPADILEIALRRLKTRSDCLVIFDNVEERGAIEPYLPEVGAEPHLLLTSRAHQPGFTPIDISLLDEERSLQLLMKESNRDFAAIGENEQQAAAGIAGSLGGLPLALEIAGAYLKYFNNCTFQDYRAFMEDNLHEAMKGDMLSSFTRHEQDLFLTLQVNKPVLERASILNDILDLLAWSGTAFMGISLMAALLDKKEAELFTPLNLGESLHLLQKTGDGKRYDIHRLLRRVRQEQLPLLHREQWIKETCQRLGDWFEERREEFNHLPAFEAELNHLKQWLAHVKPYPSIHTARLTWLQAYPSYHWGRYQEFQQLVQSAFSLLSQISEDDPKLKADILNDLGATYYLHGEFQQALEYDMQALEIRKQLFGEKHPETASSLNNVGVAYMELGDHKKAMEHLCRALEIRKQILGEQHPDMASFLNNIGVDYRKLGDYEKAMEYLRRALEIRKQLFGEQHPDTAFSFNSVGTTYSELGDHEKALEFQRQALEIQKKICGEQHPDTAYSFNSVGTTYVELGDHEKAMEHLRRALEIRIQILGEQHPDTANSLHNVGYTYFKMGNPGEALPYFKRAFDIRVQLLGKLHQDTVVALFYLVYSLIKRKEFQEAAERLEDYLEELPQDHPQYNDLSGLKKILQKEKRKGLHWQPKKKKKR